MMCKKKNYCNIMDLPILRSSQRVFQHLNIDYFRHKSGIVPYNESADLNQHSLSLFLSGKF